MFTSGSEGSSPHTYNHRLHGLPVSILLPPHFRASASVKPSSSLATGVPPISTHFTATLEFRGLYLTQELQFPPQRSGEPIGFTTDLKPRLHSLTPSNPVNAATY